MKIKLISFEDLATLHAVLYFWNFWHENQHINFLGLQTLKCYFDGSCGYEGAVIEEEKSQPTAHNNLRYMYLEPTKYIALYH